jgi:F-type H+-transporting ATPase subunit delta
MAQRPDAPTPQPAGPTSLGVNREAYATAADRLDEYARGKDAAVVAATADEIVAVAQLLTREPRLRRALADSARSGEERVGLLRGLLEGKVGADALDLLATLVAGRWSAPLDLLNAVERLGVEALLASAENAGDLAEVEDELFRFGQVVDGNPQLAATLGDSTAPVDRRAELVHALLDQKARPATIRLVELALAGFAGRSFAGALTRLVELAADRRDRQVAYVVVAAPISEDDERRLGSALSGMYGREVTLKVTVDPAVIGGISLRVGHDLYDGTVASRLAQTRNALVGEGSSARR